MTNGGVTLLISHRFSTVRVADLIVVVQGSSIVAYGTHGELMATGGFYAELYEMQARALPCLRPFPLSRRRAR